MKASLRGEWIEVEDRQFLNKMKKPLRVNTTVFEADIIYASYSIAQYL